MQKQPVLLTPGMTCANCSAAVERSLRKERGVNTVSVSQPCRTWDAGQR